MLGPTLFYASRPLIAGTGAGLIIGDLNLGMAIGATLELTALGVYTYGGATIPDYQTGAIVGTVLAHATGGSLATETAAGLAIGLPAAVLLSSLDPIRRFLPTFWIHKADDYASHGNDRGLTWMHWTAVLPWVLAPAIPTFLAALALNNTSVQDLEKAIPAGFTTGMILVGGILPAVGFGMLLKIMPVAKYWYMLVLGFVLYGYLKVPLLGIALFGLAIAFMFETLRPRLVAGTVEAPNRG
jgi:mannose/fructose/N-acetylgalactosamine-specific phosphotransferase system component IIC